MSHPDLIDLHRDPIVVFTPPPVGSSGRVDRYHAALEWLIARGTPFVLVTNADTGSDSETPDEMKARALWFKSNLESLAKVCRAFVYIEPDAAKRPMWETRAQAMAKSFPVPMHIASDEAHAMTKASEALQKTATI